MKKIILGIVLAGFMSVSAYAFNIDESVQKLAVGDRSNQIDTVIETKLDKANGVVCYITYVKLLKGAVPASMNLPAPAISCVKL